MNSDLSLFLAATVGSFIGFVLGTLYSKNEYEKKLDKEIEEFKKEYSEKVEAKKEERPEKRIDIPKPMFTEYTHTVNPYRWGPSDHDDSVIKTTFVDSVDDLNNRDIVVADPEGFDSLDDYEPHNWTRFADGVIVDEFFHEVDSYSLRDALGSEDILNEMGGYVEGELRVINHLEKGDYDISEDCRTYSDFLVDNPHLATEDEWTTND